MAVLGSPEVFHNGSRLTFSLRKALALLIYLAVEGGLHTRSKLAALLWPDSEPQDAHHALRNSLALLRKLLADPATSPAPHIHVLSEHDLLGLDPQAPLELDLAVVQYAYQQAQMVSTVPSAEQRASLIAQIQHALSLVRGPFLDGFWLREEVPFDEWHEQQQHQWQVRLHLLFDRLSSWQEIGGEFEQAQTTLSRWLELDPLEEEAYRRLMRIHLAQGDTTGALQIYAACKEHLAEELQVKPSAETETLAERIRVTAAAPSASHPATVMSRPPGELAVPLIGRAASFSLLIESFQQIQQGQPQAVLMAGEAGIGKTRLASEFVAWARVHGAEVLSGHALDAGGRLPYQPLVEALRERLEAENAPDDLLDDVWLAELALLLPELRVRYPDLPSPKQDELAARVRLFEAVARLVDALARRAPLVLLLDDLHLMDEASFNLLRYLTHSWKEHGTRVLLLGTASKEGLRLNPALGTQLSDLGRDVSLIHVTLQELSQEETHQLVAALVREETPVRSGSEWHENGTTAPFRISPGSLLPPEQKSPLILLGDFLFARTGGVPLYLLETLKLLRDQESLVPRLGVDGLWRLEPTVEMATAIAQEQSRHALLPPSVRAMIVSRLAQLKPPTRQLVMASAVLGNQTSAKLLWQLAELEGQAGVEALEEAIRSGLLREEDSGAGRMSSYRFVHELMRDVVYNELASARRHLLHQRALALLEASGAMASVLAYHAWACGETEAAFRYSVQAGDEAMAVFAVEDAIGYYEQARAFLQEHLQQTMPKLFQAKSLPSMAVQDITERVTLKQASFPGIEHLYIALGEAYTLQNAWSKAQEVYEDLLGYARQQELLTLVCMTLNRLAILAVQQSYDKAQVRALLEEACQVAQISHDQRALAETEWNLAQITGMVWKDLTSAAWHGQRALELVRNIHDQELEARILSSLGSISIHGGNFEEPIRALEAALALYATLDDEPTASWALNLPSFQIGAPLTRPLMNRAAEAFCSALLAIAQLHTGQVQASIRTGRRALTLSKEIKNVWPQVISTISITLGLLDAGAYEEALMLTQHTIALARSHPLIEQCSLTAQGRTYQALLQWEEARRTLEEVEALAETLDIGKFRVPALSQLCMSYALAGEWERAYNYAAKAITVRKSFDRALIMMDFSRHYEIEALLRAGEESHAREEVRRLGEAVGSNRRFRIPYLRSLATLAAWDGQNEQAMSYLYEAAQLAADMGLPAEQWQIQAALGSLYEEGGQPEQAQNAFAEAMTIIQGLAEDIRDGALRSRFLAAWPIQQVVQHTQSLANLSPKN